MQYRRLGTAIFVFVSPVLASCINQPWSVDRQVEQDTAQERTRCLVMGYSADSKEHANCVIALYEQKKQQQEQLRNVVAPPPSPSSFPTFEFKSD